MLAIQSMTEKFFQFKENHSFKSIRELKNVYVENNEKRANAICQYIVPRFALFFFYKDKKQVENKQVLCTMYLPYGAHWN